MGSSRLPGKVLMDFMGVPLLIFKIELIKKLGIKTPILVATTENELDNEIVKLCIQKGIKYSRGSESNVFSRFQKVVKEFPTNNIIRLTADNPLTSRTIFINAINTQLRKYSDLTTTRMINHEGKVISFVPKGLSIDIISTRKFLLVKSEELSDFEREHIIPYYFNTKSRISYVKHKLIEGSYTIDTEDEFIQMEEFVRSLGQDKLMEFLNR